MCDYGLVCMVLNYGLHGFKLFMVIYKCILWFKNFKLGEIDIPFHISFSFCSVLICSLLEVFDSVSSAF